VKLANIGIVYGKELRDTVRDRRTLITSVLVPLVLMPVLIIGITAIMLVIFTKAQREEARVMVLRGQNAPELVQMLKQQPTLDVVPGSQDYAQQINEKQLRAAVEFPEGLEERVRNKPDESIPIQIYYYESDLRSEAAVRTIEKVVQDYRDRAVDTRFAQHKLSKSLTKPFEMKRENVASAEKVSGNIFGYILPYLIITLCMTGAIYPAIDLTAGEKERGTIETILASGVHRAELVVGKFLLVLSMSVATSALTILSLALTAIGLVSLLASFGQKLVLAMSVKAAAAVLFLVLPLGILFSAVLLAVALAARSYREGQAYTMPLIFLAILPAMASMLPGVELNPRLALVPILNVSLAAKEILSGNYQWGLLSLIFLSTTVYGAAALYLAYRQFLRESVLFRT